MNELDQALQVAGVLLKDHGVSKDGVPVTHVSLPIHALRELYEAAAKYRDLCD
jgi:hypothetical protein